jgi:predicted nucleotidyltransferase
MRFHGSFLDILNSDLKLKIVKFLLTHQASMSEREIASILKVSHMSVNRTLQLLARENFVHYLTVGKAHLWRVNRRSFAYKALEQIVESLKEIPDPLAELKNVLLRHLPKTLVKRVVLFGSVAKASEAPQSDIDVFILVKGDPRVEKKMEEAMERLSNECMEVFGNRVSPYILTERQYKQKQKLEIITQVEQGIQIYP